MNWVQRILAGLTRGTPWIVALAAVVAFVCPVTFLWERALAAKLTLAFIMLTMGMTLTADDFRAIAKRPWEIAIGAVGQFTLMPLIAFALVHVLPESYAGVAVGLVLVGCCPGGVSSNLMSYICKGDVAFSVGMTTVSTLFAPALTPVLTASLVAAAHLGSVEVNVDRYGMLMDLLLLTLLPVAIGFVLNMLCRGRAWFLGAKAVMPACAVLALACIVGGVMANNQVKLTNAGWGFAAMVFAGVLAHNSLGYVFGYLLGVLARFNGPKRRTVAIEIGMQNAGMATQLARNFSANVQADVAVAAAISCIWHSFSGALLAGIFNLADRLLEGKTK